MANTILVYRGAFANIPALSVGELGLCTDTYDVYVGTGAGNKRVGPSEENFTTTLKNTLDTIAGTNYDTNFANVKTALGAADTAVAFNSQQITGVAAPSVSTDVANKGYVDAYLLGMSGKKSVRVATTEPGTLATSFANGETVDGKVLATDDRILLKDQEDGSENGIRIVQASGAPTRATDFDEDADVVNGAYCFVDEGTVNGDTGWLLTNDGTVVIGTTELVFSKFSNPVTIANIEDLSNVTITGPTTNDLIQWNGSAWVDKSLSEAGIQAALTFGIADTNAVKIDFASMAAGDYARMTAYGIEGRDASEVKTDLSLNAVENTAISTATIDGGTWT